MYVEVYDVIDCFPMGFSHDGGFSHDDGFFMMVGFSVTAGFSIVQEWLLRNQLRAVVQSFVRVQR